MSQRAPVLFVPHGGGPMPLLDDPAHRSLSAFLRDVPRRFARPEAIVVLSAHWEASTPRVGSGLNPPMFYDYYNFPPSAYEIQYPAPGAPALAERIIERLSSGGFAALADAERGYDHGLFVPLKLMYPDADIPCVPVSLLDSLDPSSHVALGEALRGVRDENVLIFGSGMSFHNMRVLVARLTETDPRSEAFDRWLVETCCDGALSRAQRAQRLTEWTLAPEARYCHPREEHLLPLQVCLGATAEDEQPAECVYNESLMGARVSAFLWHGQSE